MMGVAALFMSNAAYAAIIVIGNHNIRINKLSKNQLASIYLGKPVTLSTHEQLQPFDHSSHTPIYAAFYKNLMRWTSAQVSGYWSSLIFRGEANPPPTVRDDEQALAVVAGTPGAISYIDDKSLAQVGQNVKVLYMFGGWRHQTQHHHAVKNKTLKSVSNRAKKEIAAINASLLSYKNHHHHSVSPTMDLWPTLSAHFKLTQYYDRPEVRHEVIAYLSNKKTLQHMLRNAVPYIYYVYQQTQARGMPAEFALLPMVESGYNPFAYSSAGATGMWQMMPGTASSLGLDINWWYDARRDTIVATQAALNYLGGLHNTLHNWLLAVAAYDAGLSAIQTAQEHNKRVGRSVHFWYLPLPHETQSYVPKLLALAEIIKHARYYHVKLDYVANRPYFSAVNMNSQIDLIAAGRLADVSPHVIRRLNPGMRRWATNPDGIYTLLIPRAKSSVFKKNLAKMAGKEHISWQYHQVRVGETLHSIAKNYHTNVAFLKKINGLKSHHLTPAQGLLVPLYLHRTYSAPVAVVKRSVPVDAVQPPMPKAHASAVQAKPLQKNDDLKQLLGKIYGQQGSH